MQKEGLNSLFKQLTGVVPKGVLKSKNKAKTWLYGYNSKYDFVVISKTGQIGDVIVIQGLKIALPPVGNKCLQRHKKEKNYLKFYLRFNLYSNGMKWIQHSRIGG